MPIYPTNDIIEFLQRITVPLRGQTPRQARAAEFRRDEMTPDLLAAYPRDSACFRTDPFVPWVFGIGDARMWFKYSSDLYGNNGEVARGSRDALEAAEEWWRQRRREYLVGVRLSVSVQSAPTFEGA